METNKTRDIPLGRAGKYGALQVDCSRFADHVHEHIYVYGLRQILNDAIADKTDDDDKPLSNEELVAKAMKRLDTLYSGELRVRRDSEPADPVEAVMHAEARKAITRIAKATTEYAATKGEKDRVLATLVARAAKRGEVATWESAIKTYIEKTPTLRREAERLVKTREAAATNAAEFI